MHVSLTARTRCTPLPELLRQNLGIKSKRFKSGYECDDFAALARLGLNSNLRERSFPVGQLAIKHKIGRLG